MSPAHKPGNESDDRNDQVDEKDEGITHWQLIVIGFSMADVSCYGKFNGFIVQLLR